MTAGDLAAERPSAGQLADWTATLDDTRRKVEAARLALAHGMTEDPASAVAAAESLTGVALEALAQAELRSLQVALAARFVEIERGPVADGLFAEAETLMVGCSDHREVCRRMAREVEAVLDACSGRYREAMGGLASARDRRAELGVVTMELSDLARTAHSEDEAARYDGLLADKQDILRETQAAELALEANSTDLAKLIEAGERFFRALNAHNGVFDIVLAKLRVDTEMMVLIHAAASEPETMPGKDEVNKIVDLHGQGLIVYSDTARRRETAERDFAALDEPERRVVAPRPKDD